MSTSETNQPVESDFFTETRSDPYEGYARLREATPVYHDPFTGAYIVTRYEDVAAVFRDDETFLARAHRMGALVAAARTGVQPELPRRAALGHDDGPYHDFLRGLMAKTYSTLRIQKLDPVLVEIVDELLIDVEPGVTVDAVPLLTQPLPIRAVAYLLGVNRAYWERFKGWADDYFNTDEAIHKAALADFNAHFMALIGARRAEPQDDIITHLVQARTGDGEPLPDEELLALLVHQVGAGSETTTNLLGHMIRLLAERPDLWQRLQNDRSLIRGFTEETLRTESPVQWMMRTCTRDTEIGGCPIPRGATVSPVIAAANRDSNAFDRPDEFQLERGMSKHLAFGQGVHNCLGSPLARQEAKVMLNALLDRYTGVKLAGEPVISTVFLGTRGFESLPVRFTA